VADLAESVGGNARELVQALEAKAVSGFREQKRDELTNYLVQHGYLDWSDQLDRDEVRVRTLVMIKDHIDKGRITEQHFRFLVLCVTAAVDMERELRNAQFSVKGCSTPPRA